jgi:hypothetical protein
MSDSAFIVNIDKALANLLWNYLKTDSAIQNVVTDPEQISFQLSAKAAKKASKLSLFLYSVAVDASARNQPPMAATSGQRFHDAAFVLRLNG